MQPVAMPAISSTITLDESANQTNDRWYVGYSYLDNAPIAPYKLTVASTALSNAQNTRDAGLIDGIDDRGVAHGYENTGIVALGVTGTGFIVGDHQIATAAHCVHTDGEIRTDVEIWTYDRTGELDGGELTVAEIHLPRDYDGIDGELDYALITVVEDLSDHVQFKIGNSYNMTNAEAGTIPIHITGQPDQVQDPNTGEMVINWDNILYTHYGSVYDGNNPSHLYYTVDSTGGQSGSPMYTITRERYDNTDYYTYTALGILTVSTGPSNGGPIMRKHHLRFFKGNTYANYQ